MFENIPIETILTQGIWCALYIYSVTANTKRNEAREERYLTTIDSFSKAIDSNTEAIRELTKEV